MNFCVFSYDHEHQHFDICVHNFLLLSCIKSRFLQGKHLFCWFFFFGVSLQTKMYESLSQFLFREEKKSVNKTVGCPYRVNKICLCLDQMLKKKKIGHEPVAMKIV